MSENTLSSDPRASLGQLRGITDNTRLVKSCLPEIKSFTELWNFVPRSECEDPATSRAIMPGGVRITGKVL